MIYHCLKYTALIKVPTTARTQRNDKTVFAEIEQKWNKEYA